MTVESATYIADLNTGLPAVNDPLEEGDDHLRLIKLTLKNSFPDLNRPIDAAYIPFTPGGGILAGDVQGALLELDAECARPAESNTWTAAQTHEAAIFEQAASISAGDIDVASAAVFYKAIVGAITFTVSNVPVAPTVASFILELLNGGSFTVTWWAGITWANGTEPTLTAAGVDLLGFYTRDDGATWRGMVLAKDSK